jgi:hypothetical protein
MALVLVVPAIQADSLYSLYPTSSATTSYTQSVEQTLSSYQAQSDGFSQKSYTAFSSSGTPLYPMVGTTTTLNNSTGSTYPDYSSSTQAASIYPSSASGSTVSSIYPQAKPAATPSTPPATTASIYPTASVYPTAGIYPVPKPSLLNNVPAPSQNAPNLYPTSIYPSSTPVQSSIKPELGGLMYTNGSIYPTAGSIYPKPGVGLGTPGNMYALHAPEPGSTLLFATGIVFMIWWHMRRQRRRHHS